MGNGCENHNTLRKITLQMLQQQNDRHSIKVRRKRAGWNDKNLTKARRKVERNDGSARVDGLRVAELKSYTDHFGDRIKTSIVNGSYLPSPILAVEIPKASGGVRLLGIPPVADRWLQQAVSQQLAMKFEFDFEDESYGFRPKRNLHQAVLQAQKHINDGFQDIVDIDLSKFFEEATVAR